MQPITVRPALLTDEQLSTSVFTSFVVGLALLAAGSLSAQTPTAAPEPAKKPAPTIAPASAPAEGEVSHVVKTGDTLWDIANAYLKDPFRWPEIFRRNTDVVENPHWIYPGEVIRIAGSEVRPEVLARVMTKPAPPPVVTDFERTVFSTLPALLSNRIPGSGDVLGRERAGAVRVGEVEAAPFVDREAGPRGAGRLSAAYDRPGIAARASDQRFQLEDPVFVEVPSGRVARVGDRYLVIIAGPAIGEESRLMIPTGIVRVERVEAGQPALARIVKQFGDIRLDQSLVPVESSVPPATAARVPVSNGRDAHVLWVHEDPVLPTLQSYVVLSKEAGNDVAIGDQFTLMDATVDQSNPAPPVPAAVAQVVRVTPYAITALVVDHDQPTVRAGMPARLTARVR
jgi:LysM repeat protein